MACSQSLTAILDNCENNVGGIIEAYICNFDDVTSFSTEGGTPSAEQNKVMSFTMAEVSSVAKKFLKYQFKRNTGSLTSTFTIDPANGVNFCTNTLSLVFAKQETTKRLSINALALAGLRAVVKDANGKYWFLGANEPVYATAVGGETGTARTDGNKYTISLEDISAGLPLEVDPSALTGKIDETV